MSKPKAVKAVAKCSAKVVRLHRVPNDVKLLRWNDEDGFYAVRATWMKIVLFEKSGFSYRDGMVQRASQMAEGLSDTQLLAPDLSASVAQWLSTYPMTVATLRPEGKRGKRRIEMRTISDYGQSRAVEYPVIDVSIPFDGSPESFMIGPSRRTLIDQPAEVAQRALVVTFPDDERLEADVDSFVKVVAETLDTLRSELANLPAQLIETATRVAERRRTELQARLQRDKGRSFPID